jgi:hypothetical protein
MGAGRGCKRASATDSLHATGCATPRSADGLCPAAGVRPTAGVWLVSAARMVSAAACG